MHDQWRFPLESVAGSNRGKLAMIRFRGAKAMKEPSTQAESEVLTKVNGESRHTCWM